VTRIASQCIVTRHARQRVFPATADEATQNNQTTDGGLT
jgi:hypothetical protein